MQALWQRGLLAASKLGLQRQYACKPLVNKAHSMGSCIGTKMHYSIFNYSMFDVKEQLADTKKVQKLRKKKKMSIDNALKVDNLVAAMGHTVATPQDYPDTKLANTSPRFYMAKGPPKGWSVPEAEADFKYGVVAHPKMPPTLLVSHPQFYAVVSRWLVRINTLMGDNQQHMPHAGYVFFLVVGVPIGLIFAMISLADIATFFNSCVYHHLKVSSLVLAYFSGAHYGLLLARYGPSHLFLGQKNIRLLFSGLMFAAGLFGLYLSDYDIYHAHDYLAVCWASMIAFDLCCFRQFLWPSWCFKFKLFISALFMCFAVVARIRAPYMVTMTRELVFQGLDLDKDEKKSAKLA
eukprot:Platyproteum_vivax@DN10654_c0_g1_i1.p1